MSYRDPSEALESPIEKILEGFDEFNSAVKKRIESREWKELHIHELNELRKKFFDLQVELEKLKNDTW